MQKYPAEEITTLYKKLRKQLHELKSILPQKDSQLKDLSKEIKICNKKTMPFKLNFRRNTINRTSMKVTDRSQKNKKFLKRRIEVTA